MTDEAAQIWCETCSQLAPLAEWQRKLRRTRVAAGTRIVGYVSTYEHRACRVFTAVGVKADDGKRIAEDLY